VKALRDGRPAGAVKHLEAAGKELAPLPARVMGIRLVKFRAELSRTVEAARRWRDGAAATLEARPPALPPSRARAP
jgi:hypothetical protein